MDSHLKPPAPSASEDSVTPTQSSSSPRTRIGRSPLRFRTAVRMLAPVIWSRVRKGGASSSVSSAGDLGNGKFQEPVRLEEQLDISLLEELMQRFKSHVPNKTAFKKWLVRRSSLARTRSRQSGLMTMKEFHDTLFELLDVDTWDPPKIALFEKEMGTLFKKVDIASDGMVDWDEFCTYMMLQFEENDKSIKNKSCPFGSKPNIVKIDHNKETTTKILTDFNPMRNVTISKEGIIGVWSTELELQRTIEMENNSESERISSKRHVKMWITDAVTMPNVHKMAVATTNRDVYFYDMSIPKYTAQFHLCALGNVALCMDYHYSPKSPAGKSLLLFGTDNGSIQILTFMTPVKGLFETPFKKTSGSHIVFFQELQAHSRLVLHQSLGQVHSDWVRRVKFVPLKDFIVSCSGSGKDSLVVRDVDEKKRKTYVFRVAKGVDCFDYSRDLNVIVTGGVDHAVRLWNPYVTSKPVAIMKGHQSSLIDLVINQALGQVFSYDTDGVLKCWDVKEHVCIQTMPIRFPFGHRIPEHGPYPLHLLKAPVNSLLICSNDCLAELKLQGLGTSKSTKTTHARPLCAAIYNPSMNQVVTACEGSSISFWNLSCGRRAQQLTEAHGSDEISCVTLDSSGSRLMTGARNGSIHVWNASNGHLLNQLQPVEEAEVTGIIAVPIKSKILTVGWNRKIVMYYDDRETFSLRPDTSWKGGQLHRDDILTAAYCPPNFLATASFDGDIILWTLDREKMIKKLKRGLGSLLALGSTYDQRILFNLSNTKMKKLGLSGTSRTESSAERRRGASSPVDKLLFLNTRSQWKSQESAILVSSEAGTLEFWCVYGASCPMGSFHAASADESTVLALASHSSDEILVTGDSRGWITLWDIASYCIARTESSQAQVWSATQRPGSEEFQPEGRPPQLLTWHAHSGAVVSVTCFTRDGLDLIVSASEDCTARLWTTEGSYIGMFGQKSLWDISDQTTYKQAERIWDEAQQIDRSRRGSVSRSPTMPLEPEFPELHSSPCEVDYPDLSTATDLPNGGSAECPPRGKNFLPSIQINKEEAEEDVFSWRKSDYYRSMTSLVLERTAKQPDNWSILGDHYNKDFQRRMQTRQTRRDRLGHVDRKVTCGGGLGNTCSPFQALSIPETREYRLPEDLPVSPRMNNKGGRVSTEPFWLRISQGSLPPPLPPLKNSDSYRSLTSVNRESRTENASLVD